MAQSAAEKVYPKDKGRGERAGAEMLALRQHLDSMLIGMRSDRYSWWVHWRELADYIFPRKYRWLITPNQAARGSPINQRIMDNTATRASNTLAAGLMSGLTSPSRPWFKMGIADQPDIDQDQEVKLWLETCTKRMLTVMAESNFYTGLAMMYGDLGIFGTAPMVIDEDYEDVIRVYVSSCGEYYVANSARMEIDTLYREYVLSCRQVVQQFGLENCSDTVRQAYKTGGAQLTREVIIVHAIEPNDSNTEGMPGMKGFKWRSVYYEWGSGQNLILQMRGYHEKPFICPRWDMQYNDAYGRSPGMDALPDVKSLQVLQKRKAQGIDKQVNPPLVAHVSLKNEPASLLPGGITYATEIDKVGMKPVYMVQPNLRDMTEDIKEIQLRIEDTFHKTLFMMISQLDTVRSATEIDARREEKLIQISPMIERFESEALQPAINRIFQIMLRAGLVPPPPKKIKGQQIKIEYISMLADMQRAVQTAGIERLAAFIGNLAAANPPILDTMDWDEMADEYAQLLGVSPKIIRPMAQVIQMRQAKAQQAMQEKQQQDAMAAVQGAQVLSQTDVGGGQNALQLMAGR